MENINTERTVDTLPLVMTVPEASEVLRIGRCKAYDLVRCGQIRSIRVGSAIRIPKAALIEFLNGSTA